MLENYGGTLRGLILWSVGCASKTHLTLLGSAWAPYLMPQLFGITMQPRQLAGPATRCPPCGRMWSPRFADTGLLTSSHHSLIIISYFVQTAQITKICLTVQRRE
jgi:hypothetical protein